MKLKRNTRGLVTQSLEHISKAVFSKYSAEITQLIERSSGVYALYDENELYYVGRATSLRSRVRQHLKDRHDASWTHFSLFLVSNSSHIGEFESLLVRIANPRGNSVKPKGRDSRSMQKELEKLIKLKHIQELNELFSKRKKKREIKKVKGPKENNIVGLVKKRTPIYRTFQGIEYKAVLTPAGTISLKGKKYKTPTAAAKTIMKKNVNGWAFWYIKNKEGDWVKLRNYAT